MKIKVTAKDPEKLRRKIYQGGESVADFGRRIGVSVPYVTTIVAGTMNPSPKMAKKIADGLGVKIDSIF